MTIVDAEAKRVTIADAETERVVLVTAVVDLGTVGRSTPSVKPKCHSCGTHHPSAFPLSA